MKEENKKRLINKIITEQDLVALYTYNNFNKSLGFMQEYSEGVYYSGLKKFIFNNLEILDSFSTKNLYTLLSGANAEQKSIINEQIKKRIEKEDFFCEDIDAEVFLMPVHTNNTYGNMNEELRQKIRY